MNKLQWAAIAAFLMLAGMWTIGYGTGIREDTSCEDTSGCEQGAIAGIGWLTIALGGFLTVGAVTSMLRARMLPPLRPPQS